MGFSRWEYWSGLPFHSPGDLPNPGNNPGPPALTGRFFTTEPSGKPNDVAGNDLSFLIHSWDNWHKLFAVVLDRSLKLLKYWSHVPQYAMIIWFKNFTYHPIPLPASLFILEDLQIYAITPWCQKNSICKIFPVKFNTRTSITLLLHTQKILTCMKNFNFTYIFYFETYFSSLKYLKETWGATKA